MNNSVNSMIADKIGEKFGKLFRNKVKKHTFLGMDIESLGRKKVALSTPNHIK